MISKFKKKGEGDPRSFSAGTILTLIFMVLLIVAIVFIYNYFVTGRDNVLPGMVDTAVTGCVTQAASELTASSFCYELKSVGRDNYATCLHIYNNQAYYGATITSEQRNEFDKMASICEGSDLQSRIASRCKEDIKKDSAIVNQKSCKEWITPPPTETNGEVSGVDTQIPQGGVAGDRATDS